MSFALGPDGACWLHGELSVTVPRLRSVPGRPADRRVLAVRPVAADPPVRG
ncbi:MAG TPA: hypothetical protein VGM14_11335 [Streptosporangiaceae bacterium]